MDAASFVQYLEDQKHIVDYVYISSSALFFYDYSWTLRREIKFIWHSPWTYTKVLFLLIRYMAFFNAVICVFEQMTIQVSTETCEVMSRMTTWFMVIQIFFSEVVLCIRTWAVWNREKSIGIGLVILMLSFLVSECVLLSRFLRSVKYEPSPFPEFKGCFAIKTLPDLWANYVPMTIVQCIIFALVVISAFRSYRQGFNGELAHVIHKDGVLFYVYLLCFTTVNLITTIVLPLDIIDMLSPLQNILYAVLTIRIIINIREVNNKGVESELHTRNCDVLVFAPPPRPVHDKPHQGSSSVNLPRSWTSSQSVGENFALHDNIMHTEHIC